jgi:mono/diheme cytochrome c family protein
VEFGTHLTKSAALADAMVDVPIDADLSTDAISAGTKAYAPCISCHDPHGTNTVKPAGKPSNYMMRFEWTGNTLCSKCHI